MQLRPATPQDVPALAALGRESFTSAFGHLYRPEDLAAFLAEVHDERVIAEEIAGETCRHRLAAGADGSLLGYCKLRPPSKLAALSDAANPLELAQLYCAGPATGRGVGAALMDWALGEAEVGRHDAIHLSVYSENFGAQRFYQRYGFARTADTTFKVGEQLDAEYLFEKSLPGDQA
jgi:ribosomal protein S18 acetylase RimI-like enzyme